MNVCIVQPNKSTPSETFLRAHALHLPAEVSVVHGVRPRIAGSTIGLFERFTRQRIKLQRRISSRPKQWEITELFVRAFRKIGADVVIAEYGTVGVQVMDACLQSNIPLIVHFRGFDASTNNLLQGLEKQYRQLFERSAAIVAVAKSIREKLITLGAEPSKVFHNPSGADCQRFHGADPMRAAPVFLSVGRFVEKKAPHLSIFAFAEVHRRNPHAQLRMIGQGPLIPFCRELVRRLHLEQHVTFLGSTPHLRVQQEMRNARVFIQHSVVAPSGDSEGTPVGIMEAGASGLPVVSTQHAGIPDVVVHGETGLLVDEHDVFGMARHMLQLAEDPALAARLGAAAQVRVREKFSQHASIQRLWEIIQTCVASGRSTAKASESNVKPVAA